MPLQRQSRCGGLGALGAFAVQGHRICCVGAGHSRPQPAFQAAKEGEETSPLQILAKCDGPGLRRCRVLVSGCSGQYDAGVEASNRLAWVGAGVLLGVAVSVFSMRTVFKGGNKLYDWGIYSAAARAWVHGENPYDHESLLRGMERPGVKGTERDVSWLQSIGAPTMLVVVAPVAVLEWQTGRAVWMGLSIGLVIAMALAAAGVAGLGWKRPGAWVVLACVLLLGPVQSGILVGQPAVPAIAAVVLGVWCVEKRWPIAAGILLGVSAGLKPQLGMPFIGYYLITGLARGAQRGGGVGGGGGDRDRTASVASCRVVRCVDEKHPRFGQQRAVERFWFCQPHARSSAESAVADVFDIPRPVDSACAGAGDRVRVGVVVSVGAVERARRGRGERSQRDELICLMPLVPLLLLPIYHRYYDAGLLALVVAWAVGAGTALVGKMRWLVWVLLATYLPPVGWSWNLINKGYVPRWVGEQVWWQVFVSPFHSWMTLALAVVLIVILRRGSLAGSPVQATVTSA